MLRVTCCGLRVAGRAARDGRAVLAAIESRYSRTGVCLCVCRGCSIRLFTTSPASTARHGRSREQSNGNNMSLNYALNKSWTVSWHTTMYTSNTTTHTIPYTQSIS